MFWLEKLNLNRGSREIKQLLNYVLSTEVQIKQTEIKSAK